MPFLFPMNLLAAVEAHVRAHYAAHFPAELCYHDIAHTERVVRACNIICDHCEVDEGLRLHLLVAAWFHDAGYFAGAEGHEQRGAALARAFAQEHAKAALDPDELERLILATSVHHTPTDLAERIISDADLHYLGQTAFFEHGDLLRHEWDHYSDTPLTDEQWYRTNIAFLEHHTYYTPFAQRTYGPAKYYNLKAITRRLEQLLAAADRPDADRV